MNRIASLIFTVAVLMLAGCKSTGVIPMDQDSYMIGKKDGMPGLNGVRESCVLTPASSKTALFLNSYSKYN